MLSFYRLGTEALAGQAAEQHTSWGSRCKAEIIFSLLTSEFAKDGAGGLKGFESEENRGPVAQRICVPR